MITLKTLFTINSLSCIAFGSAFLIYPAIISNFLSIDVQAPSFMISVIGVGLIINGLHLVWAAQKAEASKTLALYFSVGDILWVVFTFIYWTTCYFSTARKKKIQRCLQQILGIRRSLETSPYPTPSGIRITYQGGSLSCRSHHATNVGNPKAPLQRICR